MESGRVKTEEKQRCSQLGEETIGGTEAAALAGVASGSRGMVWSTACVDELFFPGEGMLFPDEAAA